MTTPVATPAPQEHAESRFVFGPAIVVYIASAKFLLHLLTATRYGIFRDEMYYFACSEHMAWGYVDHPPGTVLVAWIARHLFGHSLLGLRLFPALAGAALVWLTGKLAREMGGNHFAQALAALAILPVPFYLILHHWLTNNAFEPLIWMGCIWCVLRAINTGDDRYWLWFGVLAGVGFETKYSIAFLLAGILAGAVLTPERRILKSRYLWLGALACALLALPNLLWQIHNHYPFLELMHNVRASGRDVARGPVAFILDQAANMNPILFPLWLGGLLWLLIARGAKRYRLLGWTFVITVGLFIVLKGKNYYVAPIYPMMFAAGAVGFERVTSCRPKLLWTRNAYPVLVMIALALLAPLTMPLLSPEGYLAYQKKLGIKPASAEHQNNGPLPQYFADEFGWEPMVQQIARVYHSLPPEEQAETAIFSNGWGEAAAVDFFGPKYGLPKAISPHNQYWIWGPRNYTGEIVIVLRSSGRGDRGHFQTVQDVGAVQEPYARRDEWFHIWLCRGLKLNLKDAWSNLKHYD
jgi:dolichyl-phosphate-mannose-protein mannosyltransferase